jgi:hypothetical protein
MFLIRLYIVAGLPEKVRIAVSRVRKTGIWNNLVAFMSMLS